MGLFVLVLTASIIVGATILFFKQRRFANAVNKLPGPPELPILGNTLDVWKFNFNLTKAVDAWSQQFNGFFRLWVGPNVYVMLSKPEDIEVLLTNNTLLTKSSNYAMLDDWIGRGLLTGAGKRWRERRKLLTPTFHLNILEQFVDVFNKNANILLERLSKETGREIDVQRFMNLYALDVICESAMGTSLNAQSQLDSNYVEAVHDACSSMHYRTVKPWLTPSFSFKLSWYGKTFYKAVKVLHKYTRGVINARSLAREARAKDYAQKSPHDDEEDLGIKKRSAFLDHLLDARGKGFSLSDSDIQEEVDTFMFAGHDTTSAAMSFALYNIAAHPDVQRGLQEELQDIFGDSDRPASFQDLQQMSYLERAIKESLRLFPSVPLYGRNLTEDLELPGGRVVPTGCNIFVACMPLHRDPDLWPEPLKYDPDRFLADNVTGRHPFSFVPFSAGPRNCIGQKFAMLEMKSALSSVVRRFQLSTAGKAPEPIGLVVLSAPAGVLIKLSPRGS